MIESWRAALKGRLTMGSHAKQVSDALEVRRQHQRDGNRPSGYYYRLDRIDVARGGDGYYAPTPPAVVALKSRVAIGTAVVEEHIEAAPDREAFEKGLKEGVSVRAAIKGHEEDPSVWRAAVRAEARRHAAVRAAAARAHLRAPPRTSAHPHAPAPPDGALAASARSPR